MPYQIAQAKDNVGGLADLNTTHDPRMVGLEYGKVDWGLDKKKYENSTRSCVLVWGFMTKTDLAAFMTQAGLSDTVLSAEVTIKLPANITRTLTNYNAIIHAPAFPDEAEYGGVNKYVNIEFLVSDIETV